MAKQIKSTLKKERFKKAEWTFPLNRHNFIYLGIGIAVIILGYILMSTGITEEPALPDGKWNNPMAVTIAPILLVIGYCVLIPYGLLKLFKNKSEDNN
jgi:hypothetical protein